MANTTTAPDASTSFMRLPDEPSKAWQAFMLYRDMGPERTLKKVSIELRKTEDLIWRWSSQWKWVQRARAFDTYTEDIQLKQSLAEVPLWEKRRQEALEANMAMSQKLFDRVGEMLKYPLEMEVKDDSRGIIEVHPAKWSYSSLAQIVRVAAELQAATIAEALPNDMEEDFDPDTASIDELREYVARHKRSKGEKS